MKFYLGSGFVDDTMKAFVAAIPVIVITQYECQIVTYEYEFDEEHNTVKTIFDFADQDAPDTVPVYIEKDKKPHVYIRTHVYRDFW